MNPQKNDIFISYRRNGGFDTAKHLYDLLTHDGYRVSFDIDTLRNGNFDVSLFERVKQCKDFILIVDEHAFDRTLDGSVDPMHDWMRQELAYALRLEKNIIPIFLTGVNGFPSTLPEDIRDVAKKNGPEYNRYYFNDFYRRIKDNFLTSKPRKSSGKLFIISLSIILGLIIVGGIFGISYRQTHQTETISNENDSIKIPDAVPASILKRRLTEEDVEGKSKEELRVMRNYIYAVHGYEFNQPELMEEFLQYPWYEPKFKNEKDIRPYLNSVEKYNIEFIRKYEK